MKAINNEASATHNAQPTIALLQLTRIGDLVQTVQAVQSFKKSHPNYRLILVARAQFAKPLNFILEKYFDKVYVIDTTSISPILFTHPVGA